MFGTDKESKKVNNQGKNKFTPSSNTKTLCKKDQSTLHNIDNYRK